MLYAVFDTEAEANALEALIAVEEGYPKTGRNGRTRDLEPTKQKTVRWSTGMQRLTDSKFVYECPGIDMSTRYATALRAIISNLTLEEFDPAWFEAE